MEVYSQKKIIKIITKLETLNNHCLEFENFENPDDIRNVSNHLFCQNIQNFIFSIKLSKHLLDINFCKKNFDESLEEEHLEVVHHNFIYFAKESFFLNFSIFVEYHIREIAIFYGNRDKINSTAIKNIFSDLLNNSQFKNLVEEDDIKIYSFFLALRNTIHNIGIQTRDDFPIELNDVKSIFTFNTFSLVLKKDCFKNIGISQLIILIERVYNIINKINNNIGSQIFIKHRIVDEGFND